MSFINSLHLKAMFVDFINEVKRNVCTIKSFFI